MASWSTWCTENTSTTPSEDEKVEETVSDRGYDTDDLHALPDLIPETDDDEPLTFSQLGDLPDDTGYTEGDDDVVDLDPFSVCERLFMPDDDEDVQWQAQPAVRPADQVWRYGKHYNWHPEQRIIWQQMHLSRILSPLKGLKSPILNMVMQYLKSKCWFHGVPTAHYSEPMWAECQMCPIAKHDRKTDVYALIEDKRTKTETEQVEIELKSALVQEWWDVIRVARDQERDRRSRDMYAIASVWE